MRNEREICATQTRGVNTHSLSFYPALGAGDALFVKKATGQCMDCLHLLVWLLRQRQVCPKLSFELADSSSSCHRGSWCWVCAHLVLMVSSEKRCTSQVCHHRRQCLSQVIPAWLQSTEMTEAHTEHNVLCLLPQGEWTQTCVSTRN